MKQTSDFFIYLYQDLNRRSENSVDFSTPSVKQISVFFMYLYQDLNKRPSTIDGYRTSIMDTLGPLGQHIAHNEDLHRLLSNFHRDRPKSSRNLPKWNLSVLNELTKSPFGAYEKHRPQTSHSQNCFLASFGLRQAPQRNPCLGCKQKYLIKATGKRSPCSLLLTS